MAAKPGANFARTDEERGVDPRLSNFVWDKWKGVEGGYYESRWASPTKLRITHKVQDDLPWIVSCCDGDNEPDFDWTVSLDDPAWLVTDASTRFAGPNDHNTARVAAEMSKIQAIFTQAKGAYDSAGSVQQGEVVASVVAPVVAPVVVPVVAPEQVTMERDVAAKLKELIGMRDSGALTEEEFIVAKAKALAE